MQRSLTLAWRPSRSCPGTLLYENLNTAANDPLCTYPILEKMFNVIGRIVREDGFLAWIEGGGMKGRTEVSEDEDDDEDGKLKAFDIFQRLLGPRRKPPR